MTLKCGDLTNKDAFWPNFFGDATCIILNNYGEIFSGGRGGDGNQFSLDYHIASIFANSKIGTRMVTLEPLYMLGDDVIERNLKKSGSKPGDENYDPNLTFFTFKALTLEGLGSDLVSWGSDSLQITIYLYTRIAQEESVEHALWCAPNHNCLPTAAVNEDRMLNDICVVCNKPISTRAKRNSRKR